MGNCINFRHWFGYNSASDEDSTSVANPEDGNGSKLQQDAENLEYDKEAKELLKHSEGHDTKLKSKLNDCEESVSKQQHNLQLELETCKLDFENKLKSAEKEFVRCKEEIAKQLGSAKEQLAATVKSFSELAEIMKLLDKVFVEKKQLESCVDGKNKRYVVDYAFSEDFSIEKHNLDISLQECDKSIKDLNEVIKQKKADIEDTIQKCELLKANIVEQCGKLDEIKKRLLELNNSQSKYEKEVNGLSKEIQRLSKSRNNLQSEISVKRKEKQGIVALNGKTEATIETNTLKKQDLSNQKHDTEKKIESTLLGDREERTNIAQIEGELQQIKSKIKDLKTEKNKVQNDIDEYDKGYSKHAEELDKMNSKLKELSTELNTLKVEKNQALELLETAKQELPKVQQEKSFVQSNLIAEMERIEQVSASMVEKKEELRQGCEELEKQQAEYTELQESNDIFILSYKEQLQSEINELLKELREGGVLCLKHCFRKWGIQIGELMEEFNQFLKSDQHAVPTCDSAEIMMSTERNRLQSLDSVIKVAYLLKSVIQHFMLEIDLKGLDKAVLNDVDGCATKHSEVVNLSVLIELQRSPILKNLERINTLALELSCTRFGNTECLLENVQKQMKYWEEVQQQLIVLNQAVIDMETKANKKELAAVVSIASIDGSLSTDTSAVNQGDVRAINVSHCSQRILAYVDEQLVKLQEEYEALRKLEPSIAEVELNRQDPNLNKLEEEKQQLQHELEVLIHKVDHAVSKNQTLQGSIVEKQLNFDTLSKKLDNLQIELQQKELEKKDMSTKFLQTKEIQVNLENYKADKIGLEEKLKSLLQNLEDLQQELQQSQADVATNTAKIVYGTNQICEMQRQIDKAKKSIESYEEQMTQLDKIDSADLEHAENIIAECKAEISLLKSTTSDLNSTIATLQCEISSNDSNLANCEIQKRSQEKKIKDVEVAINEMYSKAIVVYTHDVVTVSLEKALISSKIENLECLRNDLSHNQKVDALVENWSLYEKKCKSYGRSFQEESRRHHCIQQDLKLIAKELENLKHVEMEHELRLEQLQENIDQKKKSMSQCHKAVDDAERRSGEIEQAKIDLQQEIKNKEEVLAKLNSEREELKKAVLSCDSKISSLSVAKKANRESLKSCKSSKEKLEHAHQKLNTELKDIEKQLEQAVHLIDQASSSKVTYAQNLKHIEENLAELDKKIEDTNNLLKQKAEQKIEEEKKLHEVKGTIEASIKTEREHNAQLGNTKSKCEAVECEQKKLQEHCDQLRSERTDTVDTKKQMEALNVDLEKLQDMLSNLAVESHDTVKNKLQSLYEIEKWQKEMERAKFREQELQDKNEQLNVSLNSMRKREQELKDENEQHVVSLNSMRKRELELQDKNEQLNVSLNGMTKKTEDLTDENAKLREELQHNKPLPTLAPRPITGLTNLGNTCYFNSMLQGLNQATVLFQLLSSLFDKSTKVQEHVISSPTPGGKELVVKIPKKPRLFAEAMYQFYQDVDSKGNDHYCLQPLRLLSLIGQKNHRFLGRSQQDSHEAFRCLLDGLRMEEIDAVKFEIYKRFGTTEEEQRRFPKKLCPEDKTLLRGYLRKATKITTMLDKVFGGVLVNTIVCHRCHDTPQTYEPFLDLSLPITKDNYLISSLKAAFASAKKSILKDDAALQKHLEDHQCKHKPLSKGIDSSLSEFTALDELDDDNKFICQKCTAQLQKKSGKDDDYALCNVSKSLVINQLPKVLILHFKRFYLEPVVRKDNEHVSFSKVLDMAPYCTTECIEKPGMNALYTLFAVVVHSGTLHGGHYTAFVNKSDGSENKEWYYISDSHVSKCHNGFKDVERCQAYMLFYEQN